MHSQQERIYQLYDGIVIILTKINTCHNSNDGKFCSGSGGKQSSNFRAVAYSELEDYVDDVWGGDKLQPEEKVAVKKYTGGDYIQINEALRSGEPPDMPVKENINKLDNATQAWKAPRDMIVYRDAKVDRYSGDVGAIIKDHGFVSTSVYAGYNESKRFTILIPKGASVLPIGRESQHRTEGEILLPRGSRFRIEGSKTLRALLPGEE